MQILIRKYSDPLCTTLIISNEEMNDTIKIKKSLEESGFLTKRISKTTKNEAKEQKGGLLSTLLGTQGASLIGNLLTGKAAITADEGTAKTTSTLNDASSFN